MRALISLQVLNELVMDRGSSPFHSSLDCYCDDTYVTNVPGCSRFSIYIACASAAYSHGDHCAVAHDHYPLQ